MKQTNKTSLSDLPYIQEKNDFKTENYVKGLVKFIWNAQAPLTIALQGEWGSGKTSLMTRLHRELCQGEEPDFLGISINTWEYSMLSTPELTVYRILERIIRDLTKDDPQIQKAFKRFVRGAGNILVRGAREGAKVLSNNPVVQIGIEAANIGTQLPAWLDENDQYSLTELREKLEKAVAKRIEKKKQSGVIIFVDDLDRLNPPVAVEILELLKNVFTLNDCIFVLAIDYEVVVKGLEPKFGKLTNQNEREFRSFFDKIIQVPFSLPVSSYKPMEFVMNSLRDIGYFPKNVKLTDEQTNMFSAVVEASVGNNPRSIKRLINTLSLLDCIAQAKQNDAEGTKNEDSQGIDKDSTEYAKHIVREKLLNFIIVAIQICYPRIYTLLEHNPNFADWNREFASREGINSATRIEDDEPDWTAVLEAACSTDKYLTQRYLDISKLFSMIIDIIVGNGGNIKENIGIVLNEILDKASVTGVRSNVKVEEFDRKTFINKLYKNVGRRIQLLRPDIEENLRQKNNTGNGGFKFKVDEGHGYDIKFFPSYNPNNTITLKIEMSTRIIRHKTILDMSLDKLLEYSQLTQALSEFDSKISPLLQKGTYFASVHSKGENTFTSFSEELRYLHEAGHMSGDVTHDAVYLINLPKPSDFEDAKIIDAIADVTIANYDFRNSMKNWER